MIDVVQISKNVLARLSAMDYEKAGGNSSEQLIFPQKVQAKGTKFKNRISEQELRFLFKEEFRKANSDLFYSVETPTIEKYTFGKSYKEIRVNKNGQSASLDMCIFERVSDVYNRNLNIEFKHKNSSIKNIGKDVLKLLHEKQNGAFIHLLDNSDKGTLCNNKESSSYPAPNKKGTGVLNKLYCSFTEFKGNWSNENKSITIVILSLKQNILIHREITTADLKNLENIFFIKMGCGNIKEISGNGWVVETLNNKK